MFMEAVIESLKDLEMQHPHAEKQLASVSPASIESSQKDNPDASSIIENCSSLKTIPTYMSVEQHGPSKTESVSSAPVNGQISATEHPSPDTSESSVRHAFDTPPSTVESGSRTTSACSDTSGSVQGMADNDLSGNTKATLTVERNPASHIMDGLMRRWDFNLFRNSR